MEVKDYFSIGISLIALISSLYFSPIIRQQFRGKKFRQAVANKIQLTHRFGNTCMTVWVDFENSGGKRIRISQIKCFIFRENVFLQALNGGFRYLTESLSQHAAQVPLSDIWLTSDDRWSGYISLEDIRSYTPKIEQRIRNLLDDVRNERSCNLAQQEKDMSEVLIEHRPEIEISSNLVDEAIDIGNTLQRLETGNYQVLFCVYEEPEGDENNQNPLQVSGFRFTLFPSDIEGIFESIDREEYRFGYGIDLPARKGLLQVFVRSHSIDKATTTNLLKQIG